VPGSKPEKIEGKAAKRRGGACPAEPASPALTEAPDFADWQQMQEQLRRKAEELETINRIVSLTNASLDLETILESALESVIHAVQADLGVIYLYVPGTTLKLVTSRYRGLSPSEAEVLVPTPEVSTQTWRAIRERRVIYVPDVQAVESFPPLYSLGISSFITIPLYSKDLPLGSLNLGMRDRKPLRLLSMEALTSIGNQIAVAIDHAGLLKNLERENEERRKAEEMARESELRYRQIIDTSPEAVALTDAAGNYQIANDRYAHLFGYETSAAFLAAKPCARQLMTPEFLAELTARLQQLEVGDSMRNLHGQMVRRDGTLFTAEISASMIRDLRGEIKAVIGIVRDITERQSMEEALRKSEERYRTLAEAANDMIFIIDAEDRIVYANRYAANHFNVEPDELVDRVSTRFFGGDANKSQLIKLHEVFRSGKPIYFESKTPFWGRTLWLGTWLAPIFDKEGQVLQVLGVARDITEYKLNSQRLAESEQRFRETIERSVDGYYFLDKDGAITAWNEAFARILQIKPEEMVDLHLFSRATPEVHSKLAKLFAKVKGGQNIANEEINVTLFSGEIRWLSFNARRVIKDGIVIGVEGFVRDVTEQKLVAEALRISEARYRTLFDSIRYEVYGMDPEGRFREINAAFQEAWGPVLGCTVKEAIKERTAARNFKQLVRRVLATQVTVQASFSLKRASGVVHYSATLSPVLTKDGQLIGLVGMNLDVTEQVTTLESLRRVSMRLVQVQEEERRRIAREIHDSLGQHMTALQLEIAAASQSLGTRGDASRALTDALQTIEESIELAQNLCYDLRPPLLDDFGLEAALRDLFSEFQEKWGIPIEFETETLHSLLSRDAETALFRVTQEALTNVLKHAQARRIRIRLRRVKHNIVLQIQDDGRGFEMQQMRRLERSGHYGLMTMKERIKLLGGEFEVESSNGGGTTITALLPAELGEKA